MLTNPTVRVLLMLVLGVVGTFPVRNQPADTVGSARTRTLHRTTGIDRTLEPVTVKGADLPAFLGSPVESLYVYAFRDGSWAQVPAQVDEVSASGDYVGTGDGLWGLDDELVFMAQDLGDQADGAVPAGDGGVAGLKWYEVAVADPLSPDKKGWAYVVRTENLSRTASADYVDFDLFFQRVRAAGYHLGFAGFRPWMDYLALQDSAVDILDRTKVRLFCQLTGACPINERVMRPDPDDLIKNGPVRVIARGGEVVAYGNLLVWTRPVSIPEDLAGDLQFSMDFNNAVSGATFYNAVVPDGVTVDGVPDEVAETPFSPWWQLSTDMGTVIQVADTSALGGTPRNYYLDDSTPDSSDTGDWQHYGDVGMYIADPEQTGRLQLVFYFLPGRQPNVGADYRAFFENPLTVEAQLRFGPGARHVYLSLIQNN